MSSGYVCLPPQNHSLVWHLFLTWQLLGSRGPQTGMPWQHPITTAAGRKPGLGWGEWSSFSLCDQPRGDVNVNVKVGLLSSWDLSSLFTWWCLTSLKGAGGLEEIWRKTPHDYEQNKSIGERKVMWDRGTWRRATTEGTYHNWNEMSASGTSASSACFRWGSHTHTR